MGDSNSESISTSNRNDNESNEGKTLPLDDDGNLRLTKYCWEKIKGCCNKAPKYLCDHTLGSCWSSLQAIFCCGENADYYYKPLKSKEKLRDILKFHFKNPFEKWNPEESSDENSKKRESSLRRFPWKLPVQIICIILVTVQLFFFGETKFYITDFLNENSQTFSRLFVANPMKNSPCQDCPIPSPVAYVHTMDQILDQINYTASAYFDLQNRTVGMYGYDWIEHFDGHSIRKHLNLTVTKYADGELESTYLEVAVKEQNDNLHYSIYEDDFRNPNSSITDIIMWSKLKEEIHLVETITLEFNVSSVSFIDGSVDNPRCFQFAVSITIRRDYDSGSMPLTLNIKQTSTRACENGSKINVFDTSFESSNGRIALDGLVITFSTIFIILSGRSLINILYLAYRITRFLKPRMNFRFKILKPLFSIWHIMVIFSNMLAIVGSILTLLLSRNVINDIHVVDGTSIVLGLAVLGQWLGLLRFLSYFNQYNMLLRTLRVAAPNVMRFVVCTGILYIAFLLCGWLVLGPYHPKFRSIYLSFECLFSLINGDDMFNTYIMASNSPQAVFIFSKIYLYTFVALFIYVVLSLFISLIENAYGTLHEEWLERKKKQSSAGQLNDDFVVTSMFLYDLRDDEENKIKLLDDDDPESNRVVPRCEAN